MTVKTVIGNVQLATGKPTDMMVFCTCSKIRICDLVPFLKPCHLLFGNFAPKCIWISNRFLPKSLVLIVALDIGAFSKIFRYWVNIFQLDIRHLKPLLQKI